MLRTSLRISIAVANISKDPEFLSSNAQDFIEEKHPSPQGWKTARFLSSNAQDFIEDDWLQTSDSYGKFLSSNAQDFIEEINKLVEALDGTYS